MSITAVTPDPVEAWGQRLRDARAAADRAENGFLTTVRDAYEAGLPLEVIATALRLDEGDVEELLKEPLPLEAQSAGDEDAEQPPLQPVIFLRGRDVPGETWQDLKRELWVRGLATISNRTTAAHLARGGTPLFFLDFSDRAVDELKVAGSRGVYRDDKLTLELINGGTVATPRRRDQSIDVDQVVLLLHQVIGDLPGYHRRRMLAAQRPA